MGPAHRPLTPEDEPFVKNLILAMTTEELQAWLWPEAMRAPLLEMQYRGRISSIRGNYQNVEERILLAGGEAAGWMAMDRPEDAIWLLEIAVVPEHRSKGIGTEAIRELLREAGERGLPVRLHVNAANRAARLYERLGFRRVGGDEVRHLLER